MREITRESIERTSMRILSRRYSKDKMTIASIIHQVTKQMRDSLWITKRFQPIWSGILVFDGKHIKVFNKIVRSFNPEYLEKLSKLEKKFLHAKVWLCGIDSGTGDLPHYELGDEETMIDLVTYFRTLKEMGYVIKVLVCDGNDDIVRAAKFIYGNDFLVQRCTRHYLEGLKRKAREECIDDDPRTEEIIKHIQSIIQARSIITANERWIELQSKRFRKQWHKDVITAFKEDIDTLTTHLQHPNLAIPHTTNEIENLFKQLNLRLRSLGRFGHMEYAREYLKAWALWRRFTELTDCRGKRRYRNGKAPLELAGCNIVDIDYLSL